MTDPISDLLIRAKNAGAVQKKTVSFGYSKIKWEIAKVLERYNYLGDVAKKGKKNKKLIEASLVYDEEGTPKISNTKRISKPSRRVYLPYRQIHSVKNGFGVAVYSTTKGLLIDKEARKEKLGGELLFEIW